MAERTVGTLTAADIGKSARIEHGGWVHIGTLRKVEHDEGFRAPVETWVGLRYESGAAWFKHLATDHVIELRDEVIR